MRGGSADARQATPGRGGRTGPGYGFGSRLIAERIAWLHSVAPIWAISPAACTPVDTRANGSGPRRADGGGLVAYPAGGTAGFAPAAGVGRGLVERAGPFAPGDAHAARRRGAARRPAR